MGFLKNLFNGWEKLNELNKIAKEKVYRGQYYY